jgi:uncharacterized membrane protein
MQIKEQTRKEYQLSSRANAAALVGELLADVNVIDVNFEERTWMKSDDPERYRITVKFREEIR